MVSCTKRKIVLIAVCIFAVCAVAITLAIVLSQGSKQSSRSPRETVLDCNPARSVCQPIYPADYQEVIGQGFATNWVKTAEPFSQYKSKNIEDVFSKGFRNVRLRSRADLYAPPYNAVNFTWFLGNLTIVVDKCLETGIAPIISWIHHEAEAYAREDDRQNYVTWWTAVARKLKDRDYRLSFNLFTELGLDGCGGKKSSCGESLRMRRDKYNRWTSDVVAAIRSSGGNNLKGS